MKTNLVPFGRYLVDDGKSSRTSALYCLDIDLFSTWFHQTNGYELSPESLTPTDIREYKAYLQAVVRASPATINRRLASIRAYIGWARSTGQLDYSPAENIKGMDEQELAPHWLDRRQQAAVLRELERARAGAKTEFGKMLAIRDKTVALLLVHTGIRIGECCALLLEDITLGERSGLVRIRSGKGEKYREIPLNNTARQALREWLAVKPQVENNFLFLSRNGERMQPRAIQDELERIGKRLGIELTPHTLRHTCAHNMVEMGIPLDQVAAILGHKRLETTRIYTAPSQGDLEKALDRLDG